MLRLTLVFRPEDGPQVQGVVSQVEIPGWSMEGRSGTLKAVMAELIKLKVILHLMKMRVLLYCLLCFSEMRPS